ncbi:MAG: aminopeptidase [Anaerovoracaceae bacterium]|nr:aminopeptidase [Anaerovoracaceae bacterium]
MDERIKKLSHLLTTYSCSLQKGEKVLIDYEGEEAKPLVRQLIKDAYSLGARPYVNHRDSAVLREILLGADEEQMEFLNDYQLYQMKGMDAYIAIRAGANSSELADVPSDQLNMYYRLTQPTLDYRVNKTKWVILRYPNPSMAQLAGKSQEAFEDFFFDVCTLDYGKMSRAMDVLVDRMNRTDQVHLTGPGTDLTFSIKDIPAIKCAGECNIPDGEVYTAPVRDSMNGVISYNTCSEEQGFTYDSIRFEIQNGKIVKAQANDTDRINALLDTDEGARYFGEFAIGVNPYVLEPMKDTLFDEKICGSFHLTPGMAYEDADNGNKSAVHWDLVMIQRPEYGGGEIWFDGELVRKDGLFVTDDLKCLNPENLK